MSNYTALGREKNQGSEFQRYMYKLDSFLIH